MQRRNQLMSEHQRRVQRSLPELFSIAGVNTQVFFCCKVAFWDGFMHGTWINGWLGQIIENPAGAAESFMKSALYKIQLIE